TITIAPRAPATSFCGLGALTIGSKIGGGAPSTPEPAGDFGCHPRGGPGPSPPGHPAGDGLDIPPQARSAPRERDRRGREHGGGDLDLPAAVLESRDPEIVRDDAGECL